MSSRAADGVRLVTMFSLFLNMIQNALTMVLAGVYL